MFTLSYGGSPLFLPWGGVIKIVVNISAECEICDK